MQYQGLKLLLKGLKGLFTEQENTHYYTPIFIRNFNFKQQKVEHDQKKIKNVFPLFSPRTDNVFEDITISYEK